MKKIIFSAIVLIMAIASCSKKSAPTTDVSIDNTTLFSKNCARCHGANGVKDSRTPNLRTIELGRDSLIYSITHGKNKMPAWEDKLSVAEISSLADLIVGWHNK